MIQFDMVKKPELYQGILNVVQELDHVCYLICHYINSSQINSRQKEVFSSKYALNYPNKKCVGIKWKVDALTAWITDPRLSFL